MKKIINTLLPFIIVALSLYWIGEGDPVVVWIGMIGFTLGYLTKLTEPFLSLLN